MKFSECVQDYLNHIRLEKGLAKTTCLHYQCWLRHFSDWFCANGYTVDALLTDVFSVPVLRRYQYHKTREGCRPRSIHSAFHPLRGLGEFLVVNGLLDANPTKQLTMPKKDAAQRLIITDENVRALFDACEKQRTERQVALSRAVLSVFCYGGLRREELCGLHLEDVVPSLRVKPSTRTQESIQYALTECDSCEGVFRYRAGTRSEPMPQEKRTLDSEPH